VEDPLLCTLLKNKQSSSDNESTEYSDNNSGNKRRRFDGKLLLVNRGQCMFEDKATVAQQVGASGVIVVNTDVSIYLWFCFDTYLHGFFLFLFIHL
jgi:hypothetical protein